MTFSISSSTTFEQINWDNFENRPVIDESMPFCRDFNWVYDIPCCVDGIVISDTLQMAYKGGKENTPEAKFLNEYPCINSLEYERVANDLMPPASQDWMSQEQKPCWLEQISRTITKGIEGIIPKWLLNF